MELFDPSGTAVALAPVAIAGDSRLTVVTAIRGELAAGTYTVGWQMAGRDGHVTRGRFTFTIVPGARGTTLGAPPAAQPSAPPVAPTVAPTVHRDSVSMPARTAFDAESPLYVVVRWLQFTGLLIVIGAPAFAVLVLGMVERRQGAVSPILSSARTRAAAVGLWASVSVAVAALLRLLAQTYAMRGPAQALEPAAVGTMLTSTVWGWGWILQGVAVLVAAVGFRTAVRAARMGWTVATSGAVLLAFTPALSGHAAAAPQLAPLAVLADGLHVIGAGGWLGSLLLVVAVGIPAAMRVADGERGRAIAALVNAYSPTALGFAALVTATGVFTAWLHLGAVSALWRTTYGETLLLKLGIVSVAAVTGAYNWLRVRPALGAPEGTARIRRSAPLELVVGALVLLVTAVLVATAPPVDEAATGDAAPHAAPHAPSHAASHAIAR